MKYKIILSVILIVVTEHVHACKCAGPGTVKEDFNRNYLVSSTCRAETKTSFCWYPCQ
jgi:hypothetical protein